MAIIGENISKFTYIEFDDSNPALLIHNYLVSA